MQVFFKLLNGEKKSLRCFMEIAAFRAFQSNNVILRQVKNSPTLRNSLNLVKMVLLETQSEEGG